MRRVVIVLIAGILAWRGYEAYIARAKLHGQPATPAQASSNVDSLFSAAHSPTTFQCDGRIYCSQMHSCAEAEYFLSNCPGVKMDGDHDGVPCERQWCN